jgi:hypothetical protein
MVWSVVIFVFYSFSESKRSVYLLPIYPALGLLLGAWWSDLVRRSSPMPEAVTRALRVAAILVGAIPLTIMLTLAAERLGLLPLFWVRPLLHPKDIANLVVIQKALQDNSGILFVWGLVLLPVITVLFVSIRRRRWLPVLASVVGFVASSVAVANTVVRPAIAWDRTYKPLMTVVREVVKPDDELFFYNTFDYGAVFYSRRHIPKKMEIPNKIPSDHQVYVLMWNRVWEQIPPRDRARFEHLRSSVGRGSKGKNRLIFAMLKPTQALDVPTGAALEGGPERGPQQ